MRDVLERLQLERRITVVIMAVFLALYFSLAYVSNVKVESPQQRPATEESGAPERVDGP